MPPSIPRKRASPVSPAQPPPPKKRAAAAAAAAPPATKAGTTKEANKSRPKPTLFDALDAPKRGATAAEAQAFLAKLNGEDGDSDSDGSEMDSDDFEDVPQPPPKRRKLEAEVAEDDDEDEMDFEDVVLAHQPGQDAARANDDDIKDVNISLNDDGTLAAEAGTAANKNQKKGPSKRDRQIRLRTHMMHVQTLVFHNAVRNSWLNDSQAQKTLADGLSDGVKKEVQRWRVDMGYEKPPEASKKRKGKRKSGKDKEKRDGRDWGIDADRLEAGAINMSRGDPIMRLLKVLAAYWKKRFTIVAPGIRKQGYMPLRRLADDIKHWDKNKDDTESHGERIENVEHFRKLAKACEGSRDVGAQLFTALIRGLGIEARMVANLQPVGFGWSKAEDAAPKKTKPSTTSNPPPTTTSGTKAPITISDDETDSVQEVPPPKQTKQIKQDKQTKQTNQTKQAEQKANPKTIKTTPNDVLTPQKPIRKTTRGARPTTTQSDSSGLSDAPSSSDDDVSIVDMTPVSAPSRKNPTNKRFDRDLIFPHYWTEVLSPATNTYIPVDSIVLSTVANTPDLLATFEPRGRASDTAKQVIAYTLAYNSDSTAKDVTVRYLKRPQLPGRTKGFRMPVEKVPIHNKKGKVLRYEEQDWFSTVILPFLRPHPKRSEADKKEDETDLLVFKPANAGEGKQKIGEESLQWYKQSAEFVLERHLRREEALLPSAAPLRTFTSGKGDKEITEPVYARSQVVVCKTVESWHKEGRQILPGAQPMKMVPVRAVTLIRKREMEEVQRETGEKLKQGLYSRDQTEWIIPPPIGPDRRIPKNAFGNMDVYVPSMVPQGSVHVRLKGCAKLCRKMELDHAEACVGFEFGKQRAVPVLFGVVVAEENEQMVRDAWRAEQEIQRRKEDVKREALVLHLWRKFTMGLRIVERMKSEYAASGNKNEINPFVNKEKSLKKHSSHEGNGDALLENYSDSAVAAANHDEFDNDDDDDDDDESGAGSSGGGGGGFFMPGEEEALLAGPKPRVEAKIEEDADMGVYDEGGGGGFVIEDDIYDVKPVLHAPPKAAAAKPMSLQSAHHALAQQSEDEADADEPLKPVLRAKKRTATAVKPRPESRKPTSRAPAAKKQSQSVIISKAPGKRTLKREDTLPEDEGSVSDLTDMSSASVDDNDDDEMDEMDEMDDTTSTPQPVSRNHRRRASPRVVITPRISRLGSIKSRYFTPTDDNNQVNSSTKKALTQRKGATNSAKAISIPDGGGGGDGKVKGPRIKTVAVSSRARNRNVAPMATDIADPASSVSDGAESAGDDNNRDKDNNNNSATDKGSNSRRLATRGSASESAESEPTIGRNGRRRYLARSGIADDDDDDSEHGGNDANEYDEDEGDEDMDESEEEVVRPRRTTARTQRAL